MRRASPAPAALGLALLLGACGNDGTPAETGGAAVQRGIDLAVSDVLAAEQAASTPLPAAAADDAADTDNTVTAASAPRRSQPTGR